jgi:tetratricopeptide (TPR) repeat protein
MKPLMKIFIGLLLSAVSLVGFSQNAKQYFKAGESFVEAGNQKDAIAQFTKAIELNPDYLQAYVSRAEAYKAIDELQKAADDYKRALVFESSEIELYYSASEVNYLLKNYPEALDLINKGITLSPKHEEAYRLLSQIQTATEDYSNALASIDKALKLKDNPENNYSHGQISERMKNYNQAEIDYDKAIAKNKLYLEAFLAQANLKLLLNKLDKAMENCNAAFKIDPNSREAYLTRSRIYVKQTEYTKAIDDVSKLLSGSPNDKELFLIRGTYYQEFTQNQNAINDFTKAILIDPKYSEAIFKRAFSYEQVGDFKSAIKDYGTLAALSIYDVAAKQHLDEAKKRLFELNRESNAPKILVTDPKVYGDTMLKIARNKTQIYIKGKLLDESDIASVRVNDSAAALFKNGDNYEFLATINVADSDKLTIVATDVYDNAKKNSFKIERTEINPPHASIIAPYASDNGEIFLDSDGSNLYVEGTINDESLIKSILIDGVSASFKLDEFSPRFSATINVANKNKFSVTSTDIYGNDTTQIYLLNRDGVSLAGANPMGRTWIIFIENSSYETFPSLDGPSKDVTLMRSVLAGYDVQNVIHKKDMTKKEMEKFFSIELRDLLQSNKVNALLLWYAGHGKFINETGYWIPVDAKRDDEFTYYNLNELRASLQSYSNNITHTLVITDACESGPTFYQAMRSTPKVRDCNDWQAVKFKSSQVFSSAGYELAVDNSQFTKTFANALANNPNSCLPIESIVNKVTVAVSQNSQQKPKFGKIVGLVDEDGTFFFISKK